MPSAGWSSITAACAAIDGSVDPCAARLPTDSNQQGHAVITHSETIARVSGALLGLALVAAAAAGPAHAQDDEAVEPDPFEAAVEGLALESGFIDIYADPGSGRVLALLPAADADDTLLRFIHAMRLRGGLGSNPVGLDRGWGNSGQIVRLRRIGPRVVAEVENHRYRAETDAPLERAAVAESFAVSFIAATGIVAERGDGRVLVDLAGFLTADLLGLAGRLGEHGGSFKRIDDRSLPDFASLLVFPDNVEIDVYMTFAGNDPGREVRDTAAVGEAVTLIQHHSLVRLPDAGYRPRRADPRVGTFVLGYYDYAAPLDRPVVNGLAMRHRLQYNQPGVPDSGIREPIVFHIDRGAPEPVRQALVDGAAWWHEAFAAAGFDGGFRVELLPPDAHPLDIRYNVVQWVHRQTRGWSYGGGVIDPRTGEIIKGHVILGSQRVRHDRMIFEGLAGVDAVGSGADNDPVELALARIRQLSAHELGHALGFGHNFAASARQRASVMDYPAPWIRAVDDELDFSQAYAKGIGAWDRFTVEWLYREFAPGTDEAAELDSLLGQAWARGLRFVADGHSRSPGTAHPDASVWDNGSDAVAELYNVLAVREQALARFGADRIAAGRPLAELRRVLVPIYLYHRYQVAAAAKALGGVRFSYAQRGGPGRPIQPVAPETQRRALQAVLAALEIDRLMPPAGLSALLPPAYEGFWFDARREELPARSEPLFDPFSAVEAAADVALDALLHPRRAERLVRQHALDPEMPGLDEVVATTFDKLFAAYAAADASERTGAAQRILERVAEALAALDDPDASAAVRAATRAHLADMIERLEARRLNRDDQKRSFNQMLARQISKLLDRPAESRDPRPNAPDVPPGSPIGAAERCWHCYQ